MLFKNLKSGNILLVSDASTAELMRRSETYKEIHPDIIPESKIQTKPKGRKAKKQ